MSAPTDVSVGGFVPLSTVDWPGQLVATVFTHGCPWDCPYCHNPHLLGHEPEDLAGSLGDASAETTWADVMAFLGKRAGLLDGVVFSGGEPCAQRALLDAVQQVREAGFAVGLHTAGSVVSRFESVLPLVDWVGFDVKAPFDDYDRITHVAGSGAHALASLRALVGSGIEFEARTTVHPDLLTRDDLARLADDLEREGVRRWAIQGYRADGVRPGLVPPQALTPQMLPPGLAERFEFTLR
ncbi:MAG: anaerobic ribonucleoside-triphosphate reductase activating protein [Actinobacteria bacterium HGW-Actinobacteria-7]|nr:MAG: anaerobic ribonucleoside-triphosphate reductase activating protein [Actinobacteria bacterium HGW-Actinobacteria-7]